MRAFAALVLLAASPALADTTVDVAVDVHVEVTDPPPPPIAPRPADLTVETPLSRPHWEAVLAMALPMDLGDLGLHAAFGRQVGPFRAAAEYTLRGDEQRLGVAGRYRVDLGDDTVGMGFYGEAGVGIERIRDERSGLDSRRDALFGFGFEVMGGDHRTVGLEMGARFILAERNLPDEPRELVALVTVGLQVGRAIR